ncbi:hypothetical protein BOTBODRAFT_37319 [Botryobasidium botryosum FD-172 SS1]|uniref:Uncharacterized protein n=1 Tax=Botryobasidium botryosum (strain FD-172 SS1) TaxID=930990 RepID=A0A067MB15_BOTB1|nr:hypothetical protein BOTBODRAFT_37319 [Botryobasidium botryosum FD-172 SS1]
MSPRALPKTKKATAPPSKAKSSLSKTKAKPTSLKSGSPKNSAMSRKTSGSKSKKPAKATRSEVSGLELASKHFRLVNPVSASDDAWEDYMRIRLGEVKRERVCSAAAEASDLEDEEEDGYDSEEDEERIIYEGVRETIKKLEKECGLEDGVLEESIWVKSCSLDGLEPGTKCAPRNCETYSRVYSLAAPAHVDVHFQYHERTRMDSFEWDYSIGYKIHNLPREDIAFRAMSSGSKSHRARPDMESICWAYFDDEKGFRHKRWRPVEVSGFDLNEGDVLNIHRALFGPLEPLAAGAGEDVIEEHRRLLVRTVRILLAAVGIEYVVGCKDGEEDKRRPYHGVTLRWILESSGIDKWVARGIRKACGFQLASDPEMVKAGIQARRNEELELEYQDADDLETY